MASNSGIKVVMGGASAPLSAKDENSSTTVPQFLDLIAGLGIDTIDTAIIYGDSEELLGEYRAAERFTLDTKWPGGMNANSATRESINTLSKQSLGKLKVKQVDIFYLHSPDTSIPVSETLAGVNDAYKAGSFRRFGLSNFTSEQVQEVYDHCKENGHVLPSVYQGNYNAFARTYEASLLPLLHSLKISFYAYSPQAGGFLAKTADLVEAGAGRFDTAQAGFGALVAQLYTVLYKKPVLLEGLTKWNTIATEAGLRPGDMALRWVKYNSALKSEYGDALIVGPGRTAETCKQTLKALDGGPLDENLLAKIDEVWETVKDEAPVDNYNDFIKSASQAEPEK